GSERREAEVLPMAPAGLVKDRSRVAGHEDRLVGRQGVPDVVEQVGPLGKAALAVIEMSPSSYPGRTRDLLQAQHVRLHGAEPGDQRGEPRPAPRVQRDDPHGAPPYGAADGAVTPNTSPGSAPARTECRVAP